FFQAEDGIRDFHVTGVQTCALPIYSPISGSMIVLFDEWYSLFGRWYYFFDLLLFHVQPSIAKTSLLLLTDAAFLYGLLAALHPLRFGQPFHSPIAPVS